MPGHVQLRCAEMHLLNKVIYQKEMLTSLLVLERFSFECRKVIGFALSTLHDWLKKLPPIFHPIRSKSKTNRDSLARVFPRFASITSSRITSSFDWFPVLCVFFVIG